jgi:hypothetical protein
MEPKCATDCDLCLLRPFRFEEPLEWVRCGSQAREVSRQGYQLLDSSGSTFGCKSDNPSFGLLGIRSPSGLLFGSLDQ